MSVICINGHWGWWRGACLVQHQVNLRGKAVGYLLFLQEQIKGIIIVSVRSGSPAHHGEATAVVDRRLWSGRGTSCSSGAGAL